MFNINWHARWGDSMNKNFIYCAVGVLICIGLAEISDAHIISVLAECNFSLNLGVGAYPGRPGLFPIGSDICACHTNSQQFHCSPCLMKHFRKLIIALFPS